MCSVLMKGSTVKEMRRWNQVNIAFKFDVSHTEPVLRQADQVLKRQTYATESATNTL